MKKFRYYNISLIVITLLSFFIEFNGHLIVTQIGFYLLMMSIIYYLVGMFVRWSHAGKIDPFITIGITLLIGAILLWLLL